ncbi:hypothetical protein [Streptomyces niger]|uniref:hypothetical protein n=1 Tax=Streptomyces niger TaxID=66373 RepID=UPI00069B1A53|nr:hypothetical protein [Streptomyces niger]
MRMRVLPLAMTAVLLGGGVAAATTGSAGASEPAAHAAASCLGTAKNYSGTPGSGSSNAHWPGTGKWAYTTANCADINLKTNYTRTVRVCFKATGGCNAWKSAKKGVWKVIASGVKDGSGFYVQFKGVNASTGKIAY